MRTRSLIATLSLALAGALALLAPRLAGAGPDEPARVPPASGPATGPRAPATPVPAPAPSRARIRFEETTHDFGTAAHGTLVRHTFRFTNAGLDPLEIHSVRASCGCTAAEPSKRTFAPGESGGVDVAFDTAKKHPTRGRQRFVNTVTVRTNDARETSGGAPGMTRLSLEGEVAARYALVPEGGLVFAAITRGAAPLEAVVEVLPAAAALSGEPETPPLLPPGAPGASQTATARILSTPAHVEVVSVTAVERDGRAGIAIRARPRRSAPVGSLDGEIRIATANPVQPELVVPVRGHVAPAIQVVPPRLILPLDMGDAPRPLRVMAAIPPPILGVEVLPEGEGPAPLLAEVAPGAPGQVRVRRSAAPLPEGARGAAGELFLYLDHPENAALRVPYLMRDLSGQAEQLAAQRAAGVRVSPPELYLGEIAPDRDVEGSIVLLKSGAQAAPVDARDVAVDPPGLFDPHVETLTAGETQRIVLRLAHRPSGAFFGRVRFRPREGGPELSIGASGRVGPRVEVEPPALVLREGRREAGATLTRPGGGEVRVLAAEDPSRRLFVETLAAEDGAARVLVRLEGDLPLDGLRGEVRVATGVPGAEEVRIPVVGFAGR